LVGPLPNKGNVTLVSPLMTWKNSGWYRGRFARCQNPLRRGIADRL